MCLKTRRIPVHLIQLRNHSNEVVSAIVQEEQVFELNTNTYSLVKHAIEHQVAIIEYAQTLTTGRVHQYNDLLTSNRLALPIHHTDPAHLIVTGTGLTHRNSMLARTSMQENTALTEAQKIYLMGVDHGRPSLADIGAVPEWFFKGFGSQIKASGQTLNLSVHMQGGGEEAELAVIYMIDDHQQAHRIGTALGNEFSDHLLEKQNHYYLAQSKLAPCSLGPEIYIGRIPEKVAGTIEILRNQYCLWSSKYNTGLQHMVHSLDNIEHHVFKHDIFRMPGDVHVLFLGADRLSFEDNILLQTDDVIRISGDLFQHPLINKVQLQTHKIKYRVRSWEAII